LPHLEHLESSSSSSTAGPALAAGTTGVVIFAPGGCECTASLGAPEAGGRVLTRRRCCLRREGLEWRRSVFVPPASPPPRVCAVARRVRQDTLADVRNLPLTCREGCVCTTA
jgi:hypothetical protein